MTNEQHGFSGSYRESDCRFLLTELSFDGAGDHCGGWERAPGQTYVDMYHEAMRVNCWRVAGDVARLALEIHVTTPENTPIVMASLARAGTPFGALLVRALRILRRTADHYGVSLIKKYGVDHAALDYILPRHREARFLFIDGWTGKGGISRELARSVAEYNASRGTNLPDKLTVLADLAGVSGMAVHTEDYMIPSAGLNAPMNGLISKTYGEHAQMPEGSFHGAYMLEHLRAGDLSNHFIDRVTTDMRVMLSASSELLCAPMVTDAQREAARRNCATALARLMDSIGTDNEDLVKHGYAETVRAIQRRPMSRLLLRNPESAQNQTLIAVARSHGMDIVAQPDLEYGCVGICI